jgi:hypothetical protein
MDISLNTMENENTQVIIPYLLLKGAKQFIEFTKSVFDAYPTGKVPSKLQHRIHESTCEQTPICQQL